MFNNPNHDKVRIPTNFIHTHPNKLHVVVCHRPMADHRGVVSPNRLHVIQSNCPEQLPGATIEGIDRMTHHMPSVSGPPEPSLIEPSGLQNIHFLGPTSKHPLLTSLENALHNSKQKLVTFDRSSTTVRKKQPTPGTVVCSYSLTTDVKVRILCWLSQSIHYFPKIM